MFDCFETICVSSFLVFASSTRLSLIFLLSNLDGSLDFFFLMQFFVWDQCFLLCEVIHICIALMVAQGKWKFSRQPWHALYKIFVEANSCPKEHNLELKISGTYYYHIMLFSCWFFVWLFHVCLFVCFGCLVILLSFYLL